MSGVFSRWNVRAALALLLLVLGGRAWLLERSGDLPLWDQWFLEFGTIVAPRAEGRFDPALLLASTHNEHYLLYQRLSTLALIGFSGRWELQDELVVATIARAFDLVLIFLVLGRLQPQGIRLKLLLLLAGIGALPVGVFNLLSGFGLQYFVGDALNLLILALLCGGPLSFERLAGAFILMLLSLLNMATVMITAGAAILTLSLKALLGRAERSTTLPAILLTATFAAFTFLTTPRVTLLAAQDLPEFLRVLGQLAAWPFPSITALGILTLIPPLLLVRRVVREPVGETAWFLLSLCAASFMQIGSIAFARARSGSNAFPQYADGLWLSQVVGLLALAEALRPGPGESASRQVKVCGLWSLWLGAGLLSYALFRGTPDLLIVRQAVAERQPRFAQALQTGEFGPFEAEVRQVNQMRIERDFSFFDHPVGRFSIPESFFMQLRTDREKLLPLLPAALVGAPPSMTSRVLGGLRRVAPILLAAGLVLLAASLRSRWTKSDPAEDLPE